jgi:hypothetical protein
VSTPYQYVRYMPPAGNWANISEMEVHTV